MASASEPSTVDPRGVRFSACVTAVVLAASLVLQSPALLGLQLVVFLIGAVIGPAKQPYAVLFRTLIRPRLGPPDHVEDAAAPQFAQACGVLFAAVGVAGYALGVPSIGLVATGFAFAAAFLNAAFNFCIGCELYLRWKRLKFAGESA
jgi:Domain of unknown function (DUF4395)